MIEGPRPKLRGSLWSGGRGVIADPLNRGRQLPGSSGEEPDERRSTSRPVRPRLGLPDRYDAYLRILYPFVRPQVVENGKTVGTQLITWHEGRLATTAPRTGECTQRPDVVDEVGALAGVAAFTRRTWNAKLRSALSAWGRGVVQPARPALEPGRGFHWGLAASPVGVVGRVCRPMVGQDRTLRGGEVGLGDGGGLAA